MYFAQSFDKLIPIIAASIPEMIVAAKIINKSDEEIDFKIS